jgi:hypothetical protein
MKLRPPKVRRTFGGSTPPAPFGAGVPRLSFESHRFPEEANVAR